MQTFQPVDVLDRAVVSSRTLGPAMGISGTHGMQAPFLMAEGLYKALGVIRAAASLHQENCRQACFKL